MIRVILGICSVVGLSVPAFAQVGVKAKSVESSTTDAGLKLSKLQARKDVLAKSISETENRMNYALNKMKSAESDLGKAAGGATAALTDTQRDIYVKAKADYDKTEADNKASLVKMKLEAAKLDEDLAETGRKVAAEKFQSDKIPTMSVEAVATLRAQTAVAKLDKQNSILADRLQIADLRMAFAELDLKSNGINDTLNKMEKIYDKSVLGAYLQDKFGQLLNSQSICSAVKRCAVADPKKIDSEKIRQELFPESQAIRSDYYDKVNKKQATPVQ